MRKDAAVREVVVGGQAAGMVAAALAEEVTVGEEQEAAETEVAALGAECLAEAV